MLGSHNYTVILPTENNPTTYASMNFQSTPISNIQPIKRRKTKRSSIPPEQREQSRRLKKQHMERRRRASIADKMNGLYKLAMELIGLTPGSTYKVEKADILSTCHHVFTEVCRIARDEPEFRKQLHRLRNYFDGHSSCNSTISEDGTPDNVSQWSDPLNLDSGMSGDKENYPVYILPDGAAHLGHTYSSALTVMQEKTKLFNDGSFLNFDQVRTHSDIEHNSRYMAMTDRQSIGADNWREQVKSRSIHSKKTKKVRNSSTESNPVWRPYL